LILTQKHVDGFDDTIERIEDGKDEAPFQEPSQIKVSMMEDGKLTLPRVLCGSAILPLTETTITVEVVDYVAEVLLCLSFINTGKVVSAGQVTMNGVDEAVRT